MKKLLMIAGTVAALLLAVILADRATRHSVPHAAFLDSPGAGSPAPEFRLKDLQGQGVSLSQYRGKVVLVNFWATWCTPCRIEIPWLIELQEKYSSRGFTVLGVAMDEDGKKAVAPYIEKERFTVNGQPRSMNYPILLGSDEVADESYKVFGYPTSVLVGRDGRVVKRIEGLISYEEIDQAIQSLL